MYRKYTLTATLVLNSHNYLIAATQSDTREAALFHQLLTPAHLPILCDPATFESYISDSQNQNVVNETKAGFEVYFQQNLVQIRLKKDVVPLTEIRNLSFIDLLKTINLINIDFAIATKQIASNNRHQQKQSLNHSCKFYETLVMAQPSKEWIIPFLDNSDKKIHYYDIYYGGIIGRNEEKQKASVVRDSQGLTKIKKIIRVKQNKMLDEQVSFRNYIVWLIQLFTAQSICDLVQQTKQIASGNKDYSGILSKLASIKDTTGKEIERNLERLLVSCLERPEEYNIHIFNKQCQLLAQKYQKVIANSKEQQEDQRQPCFKRQSLEDHRQQESTLSQSKQQKIRLSKSVIEAKRSSNQQEIQVPKRRESICRLKYSKSELTVNKSVEHSSKGSRKLKKATLDIFRGAKLNSRDQSSSKLFAQSSNSLFSKSKTNDSSFFGKSTHFAKMSSAASNWFNKSLQESEINGKLRTYKKGNTQNNNPASAATTPKNNNIKENVASQIEEEMISKQQQDRFFKLQNRSKAKGLIASKIKQESNSQKFQDIHHYEQSEKMHEQFSMTDSKLMSDKEERKQQLPKKKINRSIVSTLNMTVSELSRKRQVKNNETNTTSQTMKTNDEASSPKNNSNKVAHAYKDIQEIQYFEPKEKVKKENIITSSSAQKRDPQTSNIIKKEEMHSNAIKSCDQTMKKPIEKETVKRSPNFLEKMGETDSKIMKSGSLPENSAVVGVSQQLQKQKQVFKSKKVIQILSESQKTLWLKHYQMILKFCNQHKAAITNLPNSSNLTFLINFLYYKTLIEHNSSESNRMYHKLIALIQKKQQKFTEEQRKNYYIYRVDTEALWEKAQRLRQLQQRLARHIGMFVSQQEEVTCIKQLQQFLDLTNQASSLLSQQLGVLYTYLKTNKAMLINHGSFSILMELGYMMTVTSILSSQRLKYYQYLNQGAFGSISGAFSFSFKQNEEEYINDYRTRLKDRDMIYLNCQEEYDALQNWVQQFS